MVNINAQLEIGKVLEVEQLLKEFKDVSAWAYKDLKWIPLKLAQHKIELDITCHNPNLELMTKARVCEGVGQE